VSFARYLRALRRSWWIIALLLLLGIGGGLLRYNAATRIYASSVTFYISTPGQAATTNNQYADNQFAQQRANTYAFLMSSQRTATAVRNAAGVNESVSAVMASISGTPKLNTVLVTATVLDTDPRRGFAIAQALAVVFPHIADSLDNIGLKHPGVILKVVSGPSAQAKPVSPKLLVNVGLAAVLGLFIGLLLAIAREVRDLAVRSSEALQEVRDLPLLGAIPLDTKAGEAPLIIGSWTQTPRAEALRQLRTNLQFVDVDAPPRVVVVTSSVPSEGKSLTAVNLAIAYGEVEERVLLVECDLRRPRVTEYLGLARAAGLSNVLAGQAEVADVVQEWGSLSVLPSGPTPPNVAAMLSSERMAEFVHWARSNFDVVVIDTPPLLPVTDAAVVSTLADGAVVVTGHAKVTRHQLSNALNSLESVHANVLGFVYNMIPRRDAHEYGGNYSAYGYADPTPPVPDLGLANVNGSSGARGSRRAGRKSAGQFSRAGRN
jgi:capsular exopolysaccharide synthesis family protein